MACALVRADEMPQGLPGTFPARAAAYVNDRLSLGELAALERLDIAQVESWLRDPAVAAEVDALAIEQRNSGQLVREQSVALLTKTVARLQALVDAGELSASTLVRVAEMAARVAGVVAPDKGAAADSRPTAILNINFSGGAAKTVRIGDGQDEEIVDV